MNTLFFGTKNDDMYMCFHYMDTFLNIYLPFSQIDVGTTIHNYLWPRKSSSSYRMSVQHISFQL